VAGSDLSTELRLGDLLTVKTLMASGADPNMPLPEVGASVWSSALLMGEKGIFYSTYNRMTITRNPEDSRRQFGPALATAAARGNEDVVRMPLDRPARSADYVLENAVTQSLSSGNAVL
jgi:hypothetical protein